MRGDDGLSGKDPAVNRERDMQWRVEASDRRMREQALTSASGVGQAQVVSPFWERYAQEWGRVIRQGVQDQFPMQPPTPPQPPARPRPVPMPLVPGPAQTSRRPVYGGVV